ncbi:MAG TPA: hypothetical protein VGT02_06965 [Methylomirabilota bacterium]|jgi:hypothetical protein|nr:hypothetical protein [Methylomirabilota bacterium]
MRRNVTAMIALMGILLPGTVLAQAASPGRETQLQQEMRHRRVIVRPTTPMNEVQRDVDVATAEIEAQGREDGIARDLTRPAPRQPQMDHDLKGGIQTRALNNALRR